jgi:hypothetical protein
LSLFDKYIEAATPHKAAAIGETGFWGHVEIGGVLTLFSDLTITTGLDNCTRIVFGPNSQADHEEKEKEAHDAFRRGEPVVFFQDKVSKLPRKGFPYIVQCPVEVFYSAPELDRDTVHEHLDVPILSDRDTSRISNRTKAEGTDRRAGTESDRARKVIGKITIDHKWATEQDVLSALNKDMFNDLIRSCPERS